MLKTFWKKFSVFFEITLFFLSEAKYKAKYGKGLKIFACKQILYRLQIALAGKIR